jgi:phosphate transport system substrate-binding protein
MRRRFTIGSVLLAALAATALLASGVAAARTAANDLRGAGATFPAPLIAEWVKDWSSKSGVQITYSPIGSGGGIASITARTVDFGASDAPLSEDQFRACNGCVQIPWALSATSIPYNIPGVRNNLRITGPLLAQIYLGQITNWNDQQLRALNPGVALPDLKITPVYRSDSSGTSFNFTEYLTKVSPEWSSRVGRGTQVNFPAGIGARGSSGVAGVVTRTPGALTYVDVAYSLANKLYFFSVRNRAGKFASPGLRGIQAAADAVKTVPANNELSIVDPPAANKLAYPISTYTYALLPLRSAKAAELKQFVTYAISAGQKFGPKLLFAPLPKQVRLAALRTLKQIQPQT